MAETVRIKVIIDAKDAKKGSKQTKEYLLDIGEAADKTTKQTKQMGLGTVTAGNLMAMAYSEVAQRALQVLKQTKELAFTVEETGSKYATVLGPQIDKTNKFLEENASLMGFTTTEGKNYVSTAVAIAQSMKMQEEAAADFGIRWTEVAADFQSFFNVPFEEGFGAIRSGIMGEQEPLKRFGIVLNEAETQERALLETDKERASELTNLEKMQARFNLIVEKAGVAIGDLQRTQDSGANVDRRYQAAKREIAEILATRTIPMWRAASETGLALTDTILDMIEQTNSISRSYRQASADVSNFRENSLPLIEEYEELTSKTELTNEEQNRLNTIIEQLAKSVPITAQEFDKFGNIIGINAEKSRAYYEQLRNIEKTRNKEEISRITDALVEQTKAAEYASQIIQDYEYYQARQSQMAAKGARVNIQSAEDVQAGLAGLKDEIRLGIQSLLDLGLTQEEINERFGETVKLSGFVFQQQKENNEAAEEAAEKTEEQVDELKSLKSSLDELLSVQGQWTEAQANEAIRIDQKIQKIEAERKARENLLKVMREGVPQGTSPISRSDRDISGESIGSAPETRSFSPTNSDSRSIKQFQEERAELEKQFTETTNTEERKRLLAKLQANQEYIEAAEQGISREEMLRNESQQRAIEQFQLYIQQVAQGYSQIVQLQGQATQHRIQKIQQEKDAALGAIDAKLQNDRLSEEQRQALINQREEAEEKYQEKIDKLQRKQFERERKAKLAEIAMNTAVAVAKIWSQTGLGAIITQAFAIGMGVAQAAVVAKQPNPYLQGGLVEERMRSGKTSPGKKLISVNENNKPEFIMNAVSTARSLPVLNRMNRDPEYAAHINRQMQSRTPVDGRRHSVAAQSLESASIGAIVAAAVRDGMEGAHVQSLINWSDFHAGYERWKKNQGFIGN